MSDQLNPKRNLPSLSAEIVKTEKNKENLKQIRESLDFAMQTVNELVAMFEPKITKNLERKDADENPLSLDTKGMQKLKIDSLVVEIDKLTQQEIFLLINSDFPELELELKQLSEEIKQEMAKYMIKIEKENLEGCLEDSQKVIKAKEKIAYFNSGISMVNIAAVFLGSAFPVINIVGATANLGSMIGGEWHKRKLVHILEVGKKRLKEILAQKILEKYDQENRGK